MHEEVFAGLKCVGHLCLQSKVVLDLVLCLFYIIAFNDEVLKIVIPRRTAASVISASALQ